MLKSGTLFLFFLYIYIVIHYVSPLEESVDILFFPLRPSVCLSFCPSIESCPLYNLITLRGISTKLHTFVKHILRVTHRKHNSCMFIFQIIPHVTYLNAFLSAHLNCTLLKIFVETSYTSRAQRDNVSFTKTIALLWIFWVLFPFGHLHCYFVSAL